MSQSLIKLISDAMRCIIYGCCTFEILRLFIAIKSSKVNQFRRAKKIDRPHYLIVESLSKLKVNFIDICIGSRDDVHRLAQTCLHLQSYRMSRYAARYTYT